MLGRQVEEDPCEGGRTGDAAAGQQESWGWGAPNGCWGGHQGSLALESGGSWPLHAAQETTLCSHRALTPTQDGGGGGAGAEAYEAWECASA